MAKGEIIRWERSFLNQRAKNEATF